VIVTRVAKNGPAARAGLRAATRQATVNGVSAPLGGDAIVAIDGKPIGTATQLADAVAQHKPGDRLRLDVERGGASRVVQITVGTAPQPTE
jgi:S1-C subfamily serine protease